MGERRHLLGREMVDGAWVSRCGRWYGKHRDMATVSELRSVTCRSCLRGLSRPTILTFHGETGEDDCGAESRWVWQENEYYAKWLHPNGDTWTDSAPGCPAPTPEAP